MTEHSFYMERAIQLARRGTGFTNPNPLVGAVIVKDHRIIGEGLARQIRRSPRRTKRLEALHRRPCRCRYLRHPGAMLPPRQAAAMH